MSITWDLSVYGRLCRNFSGNFGRLVYENWKKKNYPYFYVPNHRKVTIITYESVGRYIVKFDQKLISNTKSKYVLIYKLVCVKYLYFLGLIAQFLLK